MVFCNGNVGVKPNAFIILCIVIWTLNCHLLILTQRSIQIFYHQLSVTQNTNDRQNNSQWRHHSTDVILSNSTKSRSTTKVLYIHKWPDIFCHRNQSVMVKFVLYPNRNCLILYTLRKFSNNNWTIPKTCPPLKL